ncbi:sulfatase-like hydrolase/transferase [Haloarcula saliterrae]|uniref:sulfatase-like hydrolase/transferase n=1 Tax=Haloarcula saliterrae TaxID=2950534 RepID=UPI003AB07CDB
MQKRPNILWITLESVRADHTSMYGYSRNTTPNIQSETSRSDATVFSTPVSQSMWTPASTASMLTGTYLSTHRLGQDGKAQKKLRQELDTFPQLLHQSGYETVLFTPNSYISSSTGLDRGFATVDDLSVSKESFLQRGSAVKENWACAMERIRELDTIDLQRLKDDVAHNPTATIPRRFKSWNKRERDESPFFAYAHIDSPHHPYRPVSK